MKSGFDVGFTSSSRGGSGGFGAGFRRPIAAAAVALPATLYSNLSTYIVGGQRILHGTTPNKATEATIRTGGLNHTRVLKAASTVSVQGFKFIRVPFYNWQTTDCNLTLTLSVVSGGGGTIDGSGSGTKTYSTMSITLNPTSGRTVSDTLAGCNARRTEYDTLVVYAATPAVLTAGTYQYSVATSAGANRSLAVLWKSETAIDTTQSVYPDPDSSTNQFSYSVMEVLSVAP